MSEPAPGSVIKIENANQFAPVGVDPGELRSKFHEVHFTCDDAIFITNSINSSSTNSSAENVVL